MNQELIVYHGTDRRDFAAFDTAHIRATNVGLHFGTKAAAERRLAYLANETGARDGRILKCRVRLSRPLRVDDVFGHSHVGLLEALEREATRQNASAVLAAVEKLSSRCLAADDNPRYARDPECRAAFDRRLDASIRRLLRKLGYDGLVYRNEIEDSADSYVVFDPRRIVIEGAEVFIPRETAPYAAA